MLDPHLWVGAWTLVNFARTSPTHWGRLELSYDPATGLSGIFIPNGQSGRSLSNIWAFSAAPSPGRGILSAEIAAEGVGHTVVTLCLQVRKDEATGQDVADAFWGAYVYRMPDGATFFDPWLGTRVTGAHATATG